MCVYIYIYISCYSQIAGPAQSFGLKKLPVGRLRPTRATMDPGQFVSPSVSLLSGETLVLDDLPAGTRISDVKQHLRRRWTHLKDPS